MKIGDKEMNIGTKVIARGRFTDQWSIEGEIIAIGIEDVWVRSVNGNPIKLPIENVRPANG